MTQKTLHSQIQNEWRGYPIRALAVQDIWQSVPSVTHLRGMPFKDPLTKDILENGMRHPILVVSVSYRELIDAKRRFREKICEVPTHLFWSKDTIPGEDFRIWSVWGGSQRLTFAREHGYTHIDCAVIPSIDVSISLQKHMRAPYPQLYGKTVR